MFIYEIKKSKFLALSFDVNSKDQVKVILSDLRKQYNDADHICYAFICKDGSGMSDDGEPSGSCGKPLFHLLEIKHLSNKLIVVIRYFGKSKLGSSVLLRSYLKAAKNVL